MRSAGHLLLALVASSVLGRWTEPSGALERRHNRTTMTILKLPHGVKRLDASEEIPDSPDSDSSEYAASDIDDADFDEAVVEQEYVTSSKVEAASVMMQTEAGEVETSNDQDYEIPGNDAEDDDDDVPSAWMPLLKILWQGTQRVDFKKVLRVLPVLTAQIVFLAPSLSLLKATANKQHGLELSDTSMLPYSLMAVNCAIWLSYGLLSKDVTVILANLAGFVLGLLYMLISAWSSQPDESHTPHYVFVVSTFIAIVALLKHVPTGPASELLLYAGAVFLTLMLACPLRNLGDAIREENASKFSFFGSFSGLFHCVFWVCFGTIMRNNWLIWLPHAVGAVLMITQIIVIAAYRHKENTYLMKYESVFPDSPGKFIVGWKGTDMFETDEPAPYKPSCCSSGYSDGWEIPNQ